MRRWPWDWNHDETVEQGYLRLRRLVEKEHQESLPKMFGHEVRIHRLQLRRDDVREQGFTEQ